jgi:Zn-finger nucleic acid-binding protein
MTSGTDLTCPKCQAPMRQYERNGVTVDQCTECRGIFLDRGELDRLIDAEQSFAAAAPQSQQAQHRPLQQMPPMREDQYTRERTQSYDPRSQQQRRKKSFFEELFD